MPDVLLILTTPRQGGGAGTGDDEDGVNEMSGSGDGESELSSKPPGRFTTQGLSGKGKGSDEQNNLLMYIISASVVVVIVIIIIVVVIICCRKRAKARRARQKVQLPGQSEIKALTPNKETRVFRNMAGGEAIDPESVEQERELSRQILPPSSVAPPLPTTAKSRAAPEAEKLLKSNNSSSLSQHSSRDKQPPEMASLLHSGDTEMSHTYEDIDNVAKSTNVNQDNANKYFSPKTSSNENCSTNDRYHSNPADIKHPVVKPRKNLGNFTVVKENADGYLEVKESESAV